MAQPCHTGETARYVARRRAPPYDVPRMVRSCRRGALVFALLSLSCSSALAHAKALESRLYAPSCYNGTLDIHDAELAGELRKERGWMPSSRSWRDESHRLRMSPLVRPMRRFSFFLLLAPELRMGAS